MKKQKQKKASLIFLFVAHFIALSCNTDTTSSSNENNELTFSELVEMEVKNGIKDDSLIIGLRLGMTIPQIDSVSVKKFVYLSENFRFLFNLITGIQNIIIQHHII